jgi:glycosyltransferase involved in cell wall biosynthesis
MRVLHLLKTSHHADWAFRQIEVLRACGVDVEVVLPDAGPKAAAYREAGVPVHYLQTDLAAIRSPWAYTDALRRLRDIVRTAEPDIIHSHFVGSTLFARLALRSSRIPRVFQVPGPLHLEHAITRRADILTARETDYWIASCRMTREVYRRAGIPPGRIGLSYYGMDLRRFSGPVSQDLRTASGLSPSTKVIGMVAFYYRPKWWLGYRRGIKGHEDLIDAVRILVDRGHDITVVVAGGAWQRAERYRKKVEAYGRRRLGTRIRYLGYRDDLINVYAGFDLAVHPSLSENVGGACESLALHVPTVGTRVGGIPDIVIDGETGWLAEPGNPLSLAETIASALSDPGEAARRTEKGHALATSLLDVERTGREVAEIYRCILSGYPDLEAAARGGSAAQACPASLDKRAGSMPIVASARSYLCSRSPSKISCGEASQLSQPFAWISDSSCPGAQPA